MQGYGQQRRDSGSVQSILTAGPTVEAGFERAINRWSSDQWEVVQDEPGLPHISFSSTSSGRENTCTVRMSFTDPVPYSVRNVISRPEFVYEYPEAGQNLFYNLIELLGPGQAIVNMGFDHHELKHAVSMLVGGSYQQVRFCKRRDYPRPGVTIIMLQGLDDSGGGTRAIGIPLPRPSADSGSSSDSEAGTTTMVLEELVLLSYNIIQEDTASGDSVFETHIVEFPWPTYPVWVTPLLNEVGSLPRRLANPPSEHHIRLAENLYIVLCLQCCSRGPPLIPYATRREDGTEECFSSECVKVGGFAWVPAEESGFNFPFYLKKVLEALGCKADVWDSLDGRKLVPYQASVRGDVWEAVSEKFGEVIQFQRSAYRFVHGGKSAPKVRKAAGPHFLDIWETPERKFGLGVLEERNTFLNLADPVKVSISGLQMRKAA
eukprot:CAMPEP_0206569036 /NCGR_PEP_ID=MMETSP0325_2-20121206/26197_1 /ASSEMBLY_ACC=CAM_ASM_000347 /TAXON_ID=2866 /ORGANISM="Crypthecodinium cohnii, Strain Seligo" /LENGTH=432 /DNA_ID=CAMNT_0054072545 /DNA_START=302 /DNA_END=1597 /DNA_ORIENTATION=-